MTRLACLLSLMLLGTILVACADPNRVTFITTTNIAIDADATTQSVSIGYDRYEGYVGPAYETGAVPPIVAKIKSNLSDPASRGAPVLRHRQRGDPCHLRERQGQGLETTGAPPGRQRQHLMTVHLARSFDAALSGKKRIMFFGTGSVIGLKVRWAGNTPESVTLGYKRKEFSTLPIGSVAQSDGTGAAAAEDRYGSVLASLDMGTNVSTAPTTKLELVSFSQRG